MAKELDLRIAEGSAKLTAEWHEKDSNRKQDYIEFAAPIREADGRYDAASMAKKVLEREESPWECIYHWDNLNRKIAYSYLRWYMGWNDPYIIDESDVVGDRHLGNPFILKLYELTNEPYHD